MHWVRAIDVYAGVAKEVEPKRFRLKQADDALQAAQIVLLRSNRAGGCGRKGHTVGAQLAHARADQKKLQMRRICVSAGGAGCEVDSALGEEQIEWARILTTIDEQLSGLSVMSS